jgi:putative nucleotidyltransferase-like protein
MRESKKRVVNTAQSTVTCWPNKEQEMLLKAALLTGDEALDAWQQWKLTVNIDRLDQGSYRLLPKVYHNLKSERSSDSLMGKLKGVYRHTWYKNQLLFHRAAILLTSLQGAGIETLCLKGAAIIVLYYRDAGLRHMDDIDVLVRPHQALEAMRVLKNSGWQPIHQDSESWLTYEHAAEFRDNANRNVDLHWRVMWDGRPHVPDDDFWEAAVEIKIAGVETLALHPSDQLLHVCVHGANWNVVPPLRWVADAMTIIQSASPINWNRLIEQAEKRELTLLMHETLAYLRGLLNAPVPSVVLQTLRAAPISYREKLFFQTRTSSHIALRRISVLWRWYESFRLASNNDSSPRRLVNLARYFQSLWHIKHFWQVPLHVAYKGARAVVHIPYWYVRKKLVRRRPVFSGN